MSPATQDRRDLKARVRTLEAENELLGERAETLALLGAARRAFDHAGTIEQGLAEIMEQASVLAGLGGACFLLYAKPQNPRLSVLMPPCPSEGSERPCPLLELLRRDPRAKAGAGGWVVGDEPTLTLCSSRPKAALAVPFERISLGRGLFFFLSVAHSAAELERQRGRIEELIELLADLMEARALRDTLTETNERLEARFAERSATLERVADEQRATEARLRHERARLAATLENAAEGIVETALDRRFISANRAFVEMLGYTWDELKDKTWMDLTAPDDVAPSLGPIEALLAGEIDHYAVDKRYLHRSGSPVDAQVRISLVRDADGAPAHFVAVIRDLTHQRQMRQELTRLSQIVEQAHDAILLTDTEGHIVYTNAAFEVLTGYARAELLGQTPRVLKSGVQGEEFYRDLWATLAQGRSWQARFTNKKKDGTLYVQDSTVTPIRDDVGAITGYASISRDLKEVIELEEQLRQSQKLEAIGQLAGGVAHDFNNLLTPVLLDARMLVDMLSSSDPRQELAQEILEAGERARALTSQLLAFGRRQVLTTRQLDLRVVVGDFTGVLRRVLREDIDFEVEVGPKEAATRADGGQIEQVLMNLVLNAQDAMPKGGSLRLRVRTDAPQPKGLRRSSWVAIEVDDTGTGMDEETLRRATEPFFTTKDRGKGTGLGLATCHGIARQHGGDLLIYSAPGEGTCVRVVLPGLLPEPSPSIEPEAEDRAHHGEASALVGAHVWLVEDDPSVARSTGRLLREAGAMVRIFAAPAILLAALPTISRPDLLLTDVVLPDMDGPALYAQLSSRFPGLPVVYVSGYPNEIISPRGVREGAVRFVQKPFSRELLLREIEAALSEVAGAD